MDGTDPYTDVEFQISTTEIAAHLNVGSHCPISHVRWSIEDASGTIVKDYLELEIPTHDEREVKNQFSLFTDQVQLYNEETYRVLVQASDVTGEVFILRSNGVTVTTDELVPNTVWDGPNPNEDLNYQEPADYLSAHWADFGDGTPQQEIAYYEVAAGSNMGHPNTRTDIAPFTNVGLNTSHTFTYLDLVPETALYSVTVRATAVSGATVQATSNGIRVGHTHTISPGAIFLTPFSSSPSEISVFWDEFESNVPIRSYEWAVGEVYLTSEQLQEMCSEYLSTFADFFEVLRFTSVGLSTSSFLTAQNFTHNTTYFVTIRATDEANKCLTVMSPGMLIDLTAPIPPPEPVTLSPSESLIGLLPSSQHVISLQTGQDLSIRWTDFTDPESSIEYYEVALFAQRECGSNESPVSVTDLDYVYTGLEKLYVFEQPDFERGVAYVVEVRATTNAGLSKGVYSEPVLVDWADVVPGTVKDGLDWEDDVVFQSDLSMLSGVFTHAKLAPRYTDMVLQNDPCPNTTFYSLSEENTAWNHLSPTTIIGIDPTKIDYSPDQTNISASGLTITAQRSRVVTILSGAYQTEVDLSRGGLVNLHIQAALGSSTTDMDLQDQSITSVVFSETSSPDILADFEYENRDSGFPDITAFGLQVHHGYSGTVEKKVLLWTKSANPLVPVSYVAHELSGFDLSRVHKYTLDFQSEQLDTATEHWVDLYIDDELTTTLHSIPGFSNTTSLTLHVFNRDGFVPQFDPDFSLPRVEAVFVNVTLPRVRGHQCDYGDPFFSASSPIVEFRVGVGSSPGLTDVLDLQVNYYPPPNQHVIALNVHLVLRAYLAFVLWMFWCLLSYSGISVGRALSLDGFIGFSGKGYVLGVSAYLHTSFMGVHFVWSMQSKKRASTLILYYLFCGACEKCLCCVRFIFIWLSSCYQHCVDPACLALASAMDATPTVPLSILTPSPSPSPTSHSPPVTTPTNQTPRAEISNLKTTTPPTPSSLSSRTISSLQSIT